MHDGMPFYRYKVNVKVTGLLKFRKLHFFQVCLLRRLQWELANDH